MSTIPSVLLASELDVLGDALFDTAGTWADRALKLALAFLVLVGIARTFSFKAAIGALLAMIIALSIYSARDSLSGKVTDKIENPTTGAGAPTDVVSPRPGWTAETGPAAGSVL
ncbi:hypothetical protein [Streptomyces sp. NPDC048349]|uniref:hypothetical protein n=1 Tax=Streptomyces sp. NPDC048349 TaxID=3155486 RepID=UPI0034463EFE